MIDLTNKKVKKRFQKSLRHMKNKYNPKVLQELATFIGFEQKIADLTQRFAKYNHLEYYLTRNIRKYGAVV